EKTNAVLMNDGWFRTGDLGVIKNDYLFIKGRLKNVIIGSNGKNIYPEEVESIINSYENVLESLVFESEGKLVARVHLNYEYLDEIYSMQKMEESKAREKVNEILNELLKQVNERISTFSRINKIIEQPEPFEKTPTQKIKRYLYVQ
ncbi:MAG: long-chain fatty acid--CoA ligase, partial [Melioribacteraceae bacterium]